MRALLVATLTLTPVAACAATTRTSTGGLAPTPPAASPAPRVDLGDQGAADASVDAEQAAFGVEAHDPVADQSRPESSSTSAETAKASGTCNEQVAQDFLVRGTFLKAGPEGNLRAIQYRTDQYGYFKGFGRPAPDAQPPSAFVTETTFMGLPVKMHRKVIPALKCVEQEIQRVCTEHPYTPRALAGIRTRNTYRGGEVTNHAYGIAIDIDPGINTCCGCVKPWNEAPACKRPAKTEYDRMAMPECWVHAFERFGFYWLGHDVLRDTMHFEFLGDPDRIAGTSSPSGEHGPSARVPQP